MKFKKALKKLLHKSRLKHVKAHKKYSRRAQKKLLKKIGKITMKFFKSLGEKASKRA